MGNLPPKMPFQSNLGLNDSHEKLTCAFCSSCCFFKWECLWLSGRELRMGRAYGGAVTQVYSTTWMFKIQKCYDSMSKLTVNLDLFKEICRLSLCC